MPILDPSQTLRSERLGDDYPYWWTDDEGQVRWYARPEEALAAYPAARRRVDPVAVLSLLSFEYVCLDRTMVQGVARLPWYSELRADGTLTFLPAPPHGALKLPIAAVAARLTELLEAEILRYVEGKTRVYLLLSGGMDSRVMAAIIARLQARGALTAPVEAVTWGRPGTRDVVYAERLAQRQGWAWSWAELDAERYWRNFEMGALALGAEVDPKHLHRMDWFRDADPDAVVLAASYGDSVGRAEFSSVHLANVAPLLPSDRNHFLKPSVRAWAWPQLKDDIAALRARHGARGELGWREIERQAHYMRRMLCHTMCVINRWCRVEQILTSPEVFGFMWSLDPALRTDEVYVHMLRDLDPALLEMAWARTGARYDTGEGEADTLERGFHRYGRWLREAHSHRLGALIFDDDALARLEIFDLDQVRWMFDEWLRERIDDDTSLCTQLSAVASLALLAREHDLRAPRLEAAPLPALRDMGRVFRSRQVSRASQLLRRVSRPLRMRLRGL